MNKNLLIGVGAILVIVAFFGFNLNQKKEKMVAKVTPEVMVKNESQKYIEYVSPQTLELKNTKRVLFFYANWCSTCIPTDKEFKINESTIPEGITVIRINYNDSDTDSNEKELAKKYGITYQHTFVQIDETGDEIAKWNGGAIDELIANIE